MGFQVENLTTDASATNYHEWLSQNCQPNYWVDVTPSPSESCGPYFPVDGKHTGTSSKELRLPDSEKGHDTIGMIAIGADGNIACGTSTNGANHKIPGRVGDSPIVGSGCYADKNVGAAAATGDGDVMMRFLPSLVTVEKMRAGIEPYQAAVEALAQITEFYPDFQGGIVAASKDGLYSAACQGFPKFQYSIQFPTLNKPKVVHVKCSYSIQ